MFTFNQNDRSSSPEYAARIVAARGEDCGTCVQVEVNLATKDGISSPVLQTVIERAPERLPVGLRLVYQFVEAVVENTGEDGELREQVVRFYGQEGLVELALAIGASRFLPIVKRTLGYGTSCSLVEVSVQGEKAQQGAAADHAARSA